jgi:4-hydroxy-tetrahydrodipicolinate reductase
MSAPLPRVAICGARGRLGALIAAEAGAAFAGAIERTGPVPDCDVVIDVSSAVGTAGLLPRLAGQPLVVGTTGELPMAALAAYAQTAPVAIVPNFSVGVPLLVDLVKRAVGALPDGWQIEVVEAHHIHKKDAPSGTAKRLVRATGRDDVPTHSLRVGDTFGEHQVWLCGPGERIELKHVATRREVFAIGAVRWARQLHGAAPGLQRP